jgi:hypothetical protein
MDREAMKHTPGPWVVDPAVRQGFTVYAPKEGFIVGTQDEEGRYGAIESEANARLIAAAPDLLEALQQATSALEWRWERVANCAAPVHETAIQEAYNQARAAIAKATGEKS